MQPLIWDRRPAGLRAPAMICAFEGWNDAGDAASTAVGFMSTALGAERFAHVDTEEFYDFQANRPRIRLSAEEGRREIEWPSVEMYEALLPERPARPGAGAGRRAVAALALVQRADRGVRGGTGVQMVITLGALLADVPHTRPVAMTGFASDPALMERMGAHRPSDYEGPTGIVGVLHSASTDAGLPSMSLWASIPHYVAAAPSPKAALALVSRLEGLVGISVDTTELEEATVGYERQVGLAVSSNPEVQAFVDRLEQDEEEEEEAEDGEDGGSELPLLLEDLPSGDLLASEFQRFLRQQGDDEPPEGR